MFVKDEMLKRSVNVGFSGGEKKTFWDFANGNA
jgi:Fe-S cluster assembly ATPase SufC